MAGAGRGRPEDQALPIETLVTAPGKSSGAGRVLPGDRYPFKPPQFSEATAMYSSSSGSLRTWPPSLNSWQRCNSSNSGPVWQVGPRAMRLALMWTTFSKLSELDLAWPTGMLGTGSKVSEETRGRSYRITSTKQRGCLRLPITAPITRNVGAWHMTHFSELWTMPSTTLLPGG